MDYLCIGHVCQDVSGKGYILGGSVSYCSHFARLLGKKVGILTSFGRDFKFNKQFKGKNIHCKKSKTTTIFENVYTKKKRTQYLHQRAVPLKAKDIPEKWRDAPLVHLAPIANEIAPSVIKAFSKDTLIAATPQGWMRKWDKKKGKVSPRKIDWKKLKGIDIIILSDEDLGGVQTVPTTLTDLFEVVVLTRGSKPALVYSNGKCLESPVYETNVLDPTGAGDSFATGFLLKYQETRNLSKAMSFGHVLASVCIGHKGLIGEFKPKKIKKRYFRHRKLSKRK